MKDLTKTLDGVTAECVLEIGCGSGKFLRELSKALPDAKMVVGVDVIDPRTTVDADLLERPGFEWMTAAGHDLPFPDNSFDFVSIAHVLHHLEPSVVDATLAEMKRVLCPGGRFLVYEMYHDNQSEAQMSHVFYHHWISDVDRLCGVHHYPTFTREELTGLIETLQLKNCQIEDFNGSLTPEEENEKSADMLDTMEKRLETMRGHAEYDRLKQEVQSLNIWIMTHGVAEPTRLIALGEMA